MTSNTAPPSRVGMLPPHVRPQDQRWFAAQLAVSVALMLAMTILLIFIAASRSPAPASTGNRVGTPIVVPRPTPGPFGS